MVIPLPGQQLNAGLKVNGEKEVTLFNDEPLLLELTLFNKKAQADRRWNLSGEERLRELDELLKQGKIEKENYEMEKSGIENKKRKYEVLTLGSSSVPWTSEISWKIMNTANRQEARSPIKLMKNPETGGAALLDADAYYMAVYGISPEDMRTVTPGTYAIECIIRNMPVAFVVLTVSNREMPDTLANAEPALIQRARYYWHEGEGNQVIRLADQVLATNPVSLDALSLKGDGQLLLRSYLPALETYRMAMREYYRQNGMNSEPPEYLQAMIDFIHKEMGH